MDTSFYTMDELHHLGFRHLGGQDILISKKASIYGIKNISISNHVRIDDFCILSGNITIGEYVHIASYCALFAGQTGIRLCDMSGLSSRVTIYAESDDYSGRAMTNPTLPMEFRNISCGQVLIGKHAIIGSGCTILPGVIIGDGVSVGSMSLINKPLDEWSIYAGIPVKKLKKREKHVLEMEKIFRAHQEDYVHENL